MAKPAVWIFGNIVADINIRGVERLPGRGTSMFADHIGVVLGGNGLICAAAMATLGETPHLVAHVGQDTFGQALLAEMARLGLPTDAIAVEPDGVTSASLAFVFGDGERSFANNPGVNSHMRAADVPWEQVKPGDLFYFCSTFVLPGVDGPHGVEVLRAAKARGCFTFLDVCYDAQERWMQTLAPYLPYTDCLIPNQVEAERLSGLTGPAAQAEAFVAKGAASAVIKLGPEGSYLHRPDCKRVVPGFAVDAVDTIGAGDCYGAGLLTALVRGADWPAACRFANAVGARSVSAVGPLTALGPAAEIEAWIAGRD